MLLKLLVKFFLSSGGLNTEDSIPFIHSKNAHLTCRSGAWDWKIDGRLQYNKYKLQAMAIIS